MALALVVENMVCIIESYSSHQQVVDDLSRFTPGSGHSLSTLLVAMDEIKYAENVAALMTGVPSKLQTDPMELLGNITHAIVIDDFPYSWDRMNELILEESSEMSEFEFDEDRARLNIIQRAAEIWDEDLKFSCRVESAVHYLGLLEGLLGLLDTDRE